MKRFLVGTACLSLAACVTTPQTALTAGKGDLALWASLDSVSLAISAYAKSGKMAPADAKVAAADLPQVTVAIRAADAAYNNGATATAAQNVLTATTLLAELTAIAAKAD